MNLRHQIYVPLSVDAEREVDGVEIPVVKLEISSASHPFWTGKMREMDVDGKIDRFRR
ncbi:MAG: 50S ribosomal protein L31, partial [Acidimicrobiia bacterium]